VKEAIRIDLDGFYVEPELVPLDTNGVTEIYEPQLTGPGEGEEPEQPELVLTGYRVAIPVTQGLYRPKFDLVAWELYNVPQEYERDEVGELVLDEYDQPIPIPKPEVQFWIEGLTQEELDEIRNRAIPKTTEEKLQDATKEISLLSAEKEALRQQLKQINTDFVAFMDFYFSQNPSEA
jgi:hypothetical protein